MGQANRRNWLGEGIGKGMVRGSDIKRARKRGQREGMEIFSGWEGGISRMYQGPKIREASGNLWDKIF